MSKKSLLLLTLVVCMGSSQQFFAMDPDNMGGVSSEDVEPTSQDSEDDSSKTSFFDDVFDWGRKKLKGGQAWLESKVEELEAKKDDISSIGQESKKLDLDTSDQAAGTMLSETVKTDQEVHSSTHHETGTRDTVSEQIASQPEIDIETSSNTSDFVSGEVVVEEIPKIVVSEENVGTTHTIEPVRRSEVSSLETNPEKPVITSEVESTTLALTDDKVDSPQVAQDNDILADSVFDSKVIAEKIIDDNQTVGDIHELEIVSSTDSSENNNYSQPQETVVKDTDVVCGEVAPTTHEKEVVISEEPEEKTVNSIDVPDVREPASYVPLKVSTENDPTLDTHASVNTAETDQVNIIPEEPSVAQPESTAQETTQTQSMPTELVEEQKPSLEPKPKMQNAKASVVEPQTVENNKMQPSDVSETKEEQSSEGQFKLLNISLDKQKLMYFGAGAVALITICGITYVLYKNGTLKKASIFIQDHKVGSTAALSAIIALIIAGIYANHQGITLQDAGNWLTNLFIDNPTTGNTQEIQHSA